MEKETVLHTGRAVQPKVLVVDDRADNLMSIEVILEQDNYTIVKANSGKAALKILLNDHNFSLSESKLLLRNILSLNTWIFLSGSCRSCEAI